MFKKAFCFISFIFLLTSCGGSWDSVKRGLTGGKDKSTDEFLVQKKDPLILPPDFENLPTPTEREAAKEELTKFEKTLKTLSSTENTSSSSSSSSGSTENAILKQIKKQ